MGNRLGRIAGIAAFSLMMLRLSRLLVSGGDAPAWHLIMIASVFLGAIGWWLLAETNARSKTATAAFAIAGLVLFLRIAVPHTLFAGLFPTSETFDLLSGDMGQAIQVIRFGAPPVFPSPAVVAILAWLMWLTGGMFAWGASRRSTAAMVVPSLGLYLQFAVMDRLSAVPGWMVASAAVIGLTLTAVSMERRTEAGRVRDGHGRPIPRRAAGTAFMMAAAIVVGSVATANMAASLVPINGNFPRTGSGYGQGDGVGFDRLAGLRQRIIRPSNAIVFTAVLDENALPADQIYWRMESLDRFDGTRWRPSGISANLSEPGRAGGDRAYRYRGTSQDIAARIRIDQLRGEVVPTAGIAYGFESDAITATLLQVARDGSLIYRPGLSEGDEYVIQAVMPLDDIDLGALATGPDGNLSGLFAGAVESGAIDLEPAPPPGDLKRPPDIERFLELPEDLATRVLATALAQTEGAETYFERAWLLQYWFRDSGEFTYSTSISTGQNSLDLEDWRTDPASTNYRTGYCVQFAVSMTVLGRVLGIPSRIVWGFTPGNLSLQRDGTGIIDVRDNNAHAWVEMWMDGFGWVKFDPTPRGGGVLPESMTAAFDPAEYLPPPDSPVPDLFERLDLAEFEFPTDEVLPQASFPWGSLAAVSLVAIALGAIPALKTIRQRRRLARLRQGDITAAWEEIVDRLADLGQPVPYFLTPLEFAESADPSLVPLADSYSASVYGGRAGLGIESDLLVVKDWLRRRYESGQRMRAAFNPRSLFNQD